MTVPASLPNSLNSFIRRLVFGCRRPHRWRPGHNAAETDMAHAGVRRFTATRAGTVTLAIINVAKKRATLYHPLDRVRVQRIKARSRAGGINATYGVCVF